jgi:hypothetical protein
MKFYITISLICLFTNNANGQLTEGIWLLGGTGSFYSIKNTYSSDIINQTSDVSNLSVAPSAGYFISDKFALGLLSTYSKSKGQVLSAGGGYTNENRLDFGPFARYYFLNMENQYNLLTDINYQYGLYWFTPRKGNRHTFSASVGTVLFFNSSVGLELLLGYYSLKESIDDEINTINKMNGLQMTIGFKFHLERKYY